MAATIPSLPQDLDTAQVIDLLAAAETLIRSGLLEEAAEQYRTVLTQPALDAMPAARIEAYANYGALLLHEARLNPAGPLAEQQLDMAINVLVRAQRGHRLRQGEGSSVTTDTNLALAYIQRHEKTGKHADLMSAHLALDAAEQALDPSDQQLLEWVHSIRQLLLTRTSGR